MSRKPICIAALLFGVRPALAEPEGPLRALEAGPPGASRAAAASYDGLERWEYPDLRWGRVHFDDAGALLSWRLSPGLRRPAVKTGP